MSDHTPLTEAEVNALGPFIWGGWLGVDAEKHSDYAHDLLELVGKIKADALAARTSTATADTGHKAGCQEYPTGWLCVSDCTTVWHDKDAADTGLRERVEAVRLDVEHSRTVRGEDPTITLRDGMPADVGALLRIALAAPASTEDRADWTQAQVITARSALDAVTDYANAETARANAAEAEVARLRADTLEEFGVLLDDQGSTDLYDTEAEARQAFAKGGGVAVVRIVTYTLSADNEGTR